jgi:signal transduction histidine kinase
MIGNLKAQAQLAERLLLGALREQDAAQDATAAMERALCLAGFSRELALSLDEDATRKTIAGVRLPRAGTWTIVDLIEADGSIARLPIDHPDPAKSSLAEQLSQCCSRSDAVDLRPKPLEEPIVLGHTSGSALLEAICGGASLDLLRRIGSAHLLVVPLVVRGQVHGTIVFVSEPGSPAFTAEETKLALDLAVRAAVALDNARLYRTADALRSAAQRANKSKSELLRNMGHELRTPLSAIAGFTSIMAEGIQGPITPMQRRSLARIKANQEHLLGLITEVLNFARLESGGMTYESTAVPLPNALNTVADMLALAIKRARLRVVRPARDATVVAWADEDRVRQILLNLVMNAVKYGAKKDGTLALQCAHAGDMVTASVSDTGVGIPPEKLASIFDPYVQLPAGASNREGGVGLGLAISRDLAHGMGGDLTVVSEPGRGTSFTLTLPRARGLTLHGDVSRG